MYFNFIKTDLHNYIKFFIQQMILLTEN